MRHSVNDLSQEARETLRRETRAAFWRSMAISMAFSLPPALAFMRLTNFFVTWLSFGVPMGLAMSGLHIKLLDRLRHRSFVVTTMRQSLIYALTMAVCLSFSLLLVFAFTAWSSGQPFERAFKLWRSVVFNPLALGVVPVGLILVVPIRFMFALSQKLGPGVLRKWILGHYHEPREEERIFMFLDMKDSTTLAEQLGNLKFSALVRDFFEDMTLPILQTRCEVSHYIGDEAVLTWTMPRGLASANCVRLFYEFEKSVVRRTPYYLTRYGVAPGFKAGVHFGKVIATEVGEVKSEIVFHGDVLNTTARIQGLCASLGEDLLVSEDLAARLTLPPGLRTFSLGSHELKGKEHAVGIAGVRKVPESSASSSR